MKLAYTLPLMVAFVVTGSNSRMMYSEFSPLTLNILPLAAAPEK